MFSVVCHEGEKAVLREVRRFIPSPEGVLWLYDQMRQVPNFHSANKPLRVDVLRAMMATEDQYYTVDDVGVICVCKPDVDSACVHMTFWDRRLRGREALCRMLSSYVLNTLELNYLWTAVPLTSRTVIAFAKRVGFVDFGHSDSVQALKIDRTDLHRATQEM